MDWSGEVGMEAAAVVANSAEDGSCAMAGVEILLADILVANYQRLHRRLVRHLGCADLATESLHDAWFRLSGLRMAATHQSPEAYVFRVACNQAVDRVRSNRAWQYTGDADTELESLPDIAPGPEHIAEMRSELDAVARALTTLPRRHRDVLLSLRLEEATRQEVAHRHAISLRSVDTLLWQGLDRCAQYTGQVAVGGISAGRRPLSPAPH